MELNLSLRHGIALSPVLLREIAVTAEARGFDAVSAPEHTVVPADYESRYPYQPTARLPFPSDSPYSDALVVLGHVAAVTTTLCLAPEVVPIISRHPIALAKQAATVDLLSGGRLELGLGAGWLEEEAEVMNLPSDNRVGRLEETVEILRRAWTGESFSHQGRFWKFPEVFVSPRPPQGPDLRLWIGGGGGRTMKLIADSGAGSTLPPGPAGEEMIPKMRAALPANRRITIPVGVPCLRPNEGLLDRCAKLREAGADRLQIYTFEDEPVAVLSAVKELDVEGLRRL